VPVLSSSKTSTSPPPFDGASTHCEHVALKHAVPSAIPMALAKPPIVVGMRQTSSAISTGTEKFVAE